MYFIMNEKTIIQTFYRFLIDNKSFDSFIINYKKGEDWRKSHNRLGVFRHFSFNCPLQTYLNAHCINQEESNFIRNAFLWCQSKVQGIRKGDSWSSGECDTYWRGLSRDWHEYLNKKKQEWTLSH